MQVWQWDVPFHPAAGHTPTSTPMPPPSLASTGRPRSQGADKIPFVPLSTAPTRDATAAEPSATEPRNGQNGADVPRTALQW